MAPTWIENDVNTNKDISAAVSVGVYTSTGDKFVMPQLLADQVAGNGDYVYYVTLQVNGAGSAYVIGPKTTHAAAAGETAIGAQGGFIAVRSGDVVTVYVDGLAGDTAIPDVTVRWFELDASANVTMQQGVAVAAADANGNTPVVLYGTQGAVTFGQVKILANAPAEGALHIVNSHVVGTGRYVSGALYGEHNVATAGSGIGTFNQATGTDSRGMANSGVLFGLQNYGGSADVDGVDPAGIRSAIGLAAANLDTQLAALPTDQQVRDAMKLAPTAGAPAAGSVDAKLDDILEDTGTTLPAMISDLPTASEIDTELSSTHGGGSWEGGGGGSYAGDGTGYYTDTIDDGTSPLDGVRVQLYTAQNRVGPAYEAYTNALGVFEMWPDPGTYYRWLDYAGVSFAQDVAVTVTEP